MGDEDSDLMADAYINESFHQDFELKAEADKADTEAQPRKSRLPFGKYKDCALDEVPESYIEWLVAEGADSRSDIF